MQCKKKNYTQIYLFIYMIFFFFFFLGNGFVEVGINEKIRSESEISGFLLTPMKKLTRYFFCDL